MLDLAEDVGLKQLRPQLVRTPLS
ncbi:MAG: hypothetical protein JWO63_3356, partial [Frankiales bacterium]|nr:hypothetical protein [Frankiales bacterium]